MQINTSVDLKNAIEFLTVKEAAEKIAMRQQFNEVADKFTPSNFLRSFAGNIADDPEVATTAIGTSLAVGAGMLSKKIIVGRSGNIFKNILGTIVEFAVIGGMRKKADVIASVGIDLLKKVVR